MEPWVLVHLRGQLAAVRALHVLEITSDPRPRTIPGAPPYLRGLVRLREDTVPLIDLRAFLGLPSAEEELSGLLDVFRGREQDHRRWMEALFESLTDDVPFTLTLDPHQCAFGRWFDGYRTENLVVAAQLKRIEVPHSLLHTGGAATLRLHAEGKRAEALAAAKHLRANVFRQTLALFEEAQRLVAEESREVALVVRAGRQRMALAVDSAEAVEPLHLLPAEKRTSPLIEGYARRTRGEGMVMLLDLERLLTEAGMSQAA